MNAIDSFQVFDVVFVLTGCGPGYATSVLVTCAYENGLRQRRPAAAAYFVDGMCSSESGSAACAGELPGTVEPAGLNREETD